MPCRYDPSPEEEATSRRISASKVAATEQTINRLSVRVDYLQDVIWRLTRATDVLRLDPEDEEVVRILDEQERHRQDDLDRLAKVFASNLKQHKSKLKAVLEADPSKPLEPQLGFNPDAF